MNRTEKALAYIDKDGQGLEIGPSYNPVMSKSSNPNLKTVDHLDKEGLINKYRHLAPEFLVKIEDVDYIWTDGSLVDVIKEVNKFDYIIASHVIEHTVDLIGFLQDCEKLLKPNGILSLVVPDKRFCFDRFKSLSSLGEVIYSHLNKHPFHSIDAIINHHVYGVVKGDNRLAWNSSDVGNLNLQHPQIGYLRNLIDEKTFESAYHDVHHWIFTPNSFSLLMQDLHQLQFLTLSEYGSFDTSEFEFFISLSKSQESVMYKNRLEMLMGIEKEMTAKLDSIAKSGNLLQYPCESIFFSVNGNNRDMNNNLFATVSAIIPVFNGKKYLKLAIESVINQTVKVNELIIVDDGSSDNSVESIDGIDAPFPIHIVSQKNAGQSSARNHGVRIAKSEFIAFLDQDDYWLPYHIEKLLTPFISDTSLGWVYSNLNQIDENGKTMNIDLLNYCPAAHPKRQLTECLTNDLFILPSASIIRKTAFNDVGGFDERLSGYEDDDLFLRLFRNGWHHTYLNEALSAWRTHQSSSSYSRRMLLSRRIYADKLLESFQDQITFNLYYRRDCIAPRFFRIAVQEYMRGIRIRNFELCKESYIDIIKYSSYFTLNYKNRIRKIMFKFPRLIVLIYSLVNRQRKA